MQSGSIHCDGGSPINIPTATQHVTIMGSANVTKFFVYVYDVPANQSATINGKVI